MYKQLKKSENIFNNNHLFLIQQIYNKKDE